MTTCDACGEVFTGTKCACGWQAPRLAVDDRPVFSLSQCANPACTNMIRDYTRNPGIRFCKWCQAKGLTFESIAGAEPPAAGGPYLSKAEFGETLFRVIGLFAGRELVRSHYKLKVTDLDLQAPARKRQLEALKQREADLTKEITALMPSLPPEDQRDLLRRYEGGP